MEILSPAGNTKLINAAIKAKANAVYGGFKLWNARNNAINFTLKEYNIAITKIHKNNMKFYLTLNNLVLDEEIEEIVDFLKNKNLILPDAFIVADIGLAIKLKKEFPNIELHISTQFGAHNLSDVNFLKSINAKRIILAREITMEELSKLRQNTTIELECFIWGSQCLSFSGLCFFGSLINGGTGNRGKCINMCRDIYEFKDYKGNLLYVSDMNAINLIPQLKNIDSLKIEGRRRESYEIEKVIEKIKTGKDNNNIAGYLYGLEEEKNNLHYLVNRRIKPLYKSSQLEHIDANDVFVQVKQNKLIKYCDAHDKDAYYVYTEILQDYEVKKYNYYIEIFLNKSNYISKLSITNYKGENSIIEHPSKKQNFQVFNPREYMHNMNNQYDNIKLIKIKYVRNNDNKNIIIDNALLNKLNVYFENEYKKINKQVGYNKTKTHVKCLYIQSADKDLISKFVNDKRIKNNIKFIYEIASMAELKMIENITKSLGKDVIYRLPIFNWKGENIKKYCKKLEGFQVMFTRYSQIFECQKMNFTKRYADYLVYAWNKISKGKLKEMGIDEFCASPELSFRQNHNIFYGEKVQYFFGGRAPLVYSRNCFKKFFECNECKKDNNKIIDKSKNMKFIITCKEDHREIIYRKPILNNYTKAGLNNINLRYVSNINAEKEIELLIEGMKSNDLYKFLKKNKMWKNSYECNLLEGKE